MAHKWQTQNLSQGSSSHDAYLKQKASIMFNSEKLNKFLLKQEQGKNIHYHQKLLCSGFQDVKSLQSCPIICNLIAVALQVPLSMGFSRQEYWSGLPLPPLVDLPDPGIKPMSLVSSALAGRFFTTSATWEAHNILEILVNINR